MNILITMMKLKKIKIKFVFRDFLLILQIVNFYQFRNSVKTELTTYLVQYILENKNIKATKYDW